MGLLPPIDVRNACAEDAVLAKQTIEEGGFRLKRVTRTFSIWTRQFMGQEFVLVAPLHVAWELLLEDEIPC